MNVTEIDNARDLILPGETAIVLLTRGDLFIWNSDDTGTTGNWRFNPHGGRQLSKVIICYEFDDRQSSDVLMANYLGVLHPVDVGKYDTPDRWVIKMSGIRKVGTTRKNWKRFADAGTNPVRYLSK